MSLTYKALVCRKSEKTDCVKWETMNYLWLALKKKMKFECLLKTTGKKIQFSNEDTLN